MTNSQLTKATFHAALQHEFELFVRKAFEATHPHKEIIWASYLDIFVAFAKQIDAGELRMATLAAPPRHLKSFVLTVCMPCWSLGKNPFLKIIVSSHNDTLAKELAHTRKKILDSDWFKKTFPDFGILADRCKTMDFKTTQGGGILSTTLRTGVSGRGGDIIIVDDPIAVTDQYSSAARQDAIRIFNTELMNRRDTPKSSNVLVLGHRIHVNDLIGDLATKDGWKHVSLPFEAPEDEVLGLGDVTLDRKKGELLAPDRFDQANIEEIKSNAAEFQSLYQQNPQEVSAGYIRRDHFHRQKSPEAGDIVTSWDVASTTSESSSYSVALVFRRCGHIHHLIDVWRQRADYSELKGVAKQLDKIYRPSVHLIEKASLGSALAGEFEEEGIAVKLITTGTKSKMQRLTEVLNTITAKRVVLPDTDAAWIEPFLNEVISFPAAAHDDQVDALTQYLSWADVSSPTEGQGRVVRVIKPLPNRATTHSNSTIMDVKRRLKPKSFRRSRHR